MENYNDNKTSGNISGFDSTNNDSNGYTVTPEGGYYNRQHGDIIQDNRQPSVGEEKFSHKDSADQGETGYSAGNPENSGNYKNHGFDGYFRSGELLAKKPKAKKKYGLGAVVLSAVLAAVIGAASSIGVISFRSGTGNSGTQSGINSDITQSKVNINVDKTAGSVVEAVAEKAVPSVVGIRTVSSVMNFFGGTSESSGEGSGVVYSSDGYIITNYHVISGALNGSSNSKVMVYLDSADSEGYNATVVGYNISADLAVIKINAENLTPVEFSDSDDLKVGQFVITIGNPGGLEFMGSVTYGVISGLNRVVSSDSDVKLIQTDAAINPGNSGGALLDVNGKLVGINSSKIVSEEFEGMGFAIPSNTVKEICQDIIERENDPEPYIGISISERYTSDVLDYFGYPAGAVVLSVAENSPADEAGIERGDIITEYNGTKISEYSVLEDCIMESTPGKEVSVKIYRGGRYYTTTMTVGSNNSAR